MAQTAVQASAVGQGAPAGAGTPLITPKRAAARLGAVHVVQLVALEAILLGVLVAAQFGVAVIATVATLGLVLAVLLVLRRRERWFMENALLAQGARRRRSRTPDPREPDLRLAALRLLAPKLSVQDVTGPGDLRLGVGYDGEGWFAAAAIARPDGSNAGMTSPAVLARILDRYRLPGGSDAGPVTAAVQLVTFTNTRAHAQGYLAARSTWVALRVDARPLAETGVADAPGNDSAPPQLTRLVRRMTQVLEADGLSVQVLDGDDLLDALSQCCDVAAQPGGGENPHEEWGFWRAGGLDHVNFWVQNWPAPDTCQTLFNELSFLRGAATTTVTLRILAERPAPLTGGTQAAAPGASPDDQFDIRGLIRIGAGATELETICAAAHSVAAATGAKLFRLDGEQAPAIYATAPTGGGPQ